MRKKMEFRMPTAYAILLTLLVVVSVVTIFVPGVRSASLSDVVMAPVNGFVSALDVAIFVMFLGGFLGVVNKSGALDNGIAAVVRRLKGNEMLLIPILMILFSVGGTTYGMAEESIAFYSLIVATMVAAGFDTLVGAAIIMLGCGVGVIGSTVNPFAISAAVDAIKGAFPDIEINQTIIIVIGLILWFSSLAVAIFFVMRYARKVKNNTGRGLLTPREHEAAHKTYHEESAAEKGADFDAVSAVSEKSIEFTGRMKAVLVVFAIAFGVMVVSLIPWQNFGITIFKNTSLLTGANLGEWYFKELQAWFFLCSIIAGIIGKLHESEIVQSFVSGAADMVGVALIIAISRGISVIMGSTGLDMFVLGKFSGLLSDVSPTVFTIGTYVVYLGLSFLIPSSSGLAAASIPTFGGLASQLGLSPEVMIMIFCAANGLVNLITPTSGVVMGGLAISRLEWMTWVKFALKVLGVLLVINLLVLCAAMVILS
ncbi:MAG: YfcC family protein [Lachnospiraceae bacterium]|nr:YfcC family protein [Lachnospiraceae bacterium]